MQDCPGHPDGSTPRGSSPAHESFIQAGHLTQTVTKLQFHAKKSQKADHIATARPAGVSQVHDLDTPEFSALSARERKMPRSVKFIKGISPKNWLQSTSRAHSNSASAAVWEFSESEHFDCMCVLNSDSIWGDSNLMVRLNLYSISLLCFKCTSDKSQFFKMTHSRKLQNSIWHFCCSSHCPQTEIWNWNAWNLNYQGNVPATRKVVNVGSNFGIE